MDEKVQAWLELKAYEQICHIWTRFIWRVHNVKPESISYSAEGSVQFRSARTSLQSARKMGRGYFQYNAYMDRMGASQHGLDFGIYKNRLEVVAAQIRNSARSVYSKDRPRTNFKINVGHSAKGGKGAGRGVMELQLGYMWKRRIAPLYNKYKLDYDWMILDAVQFKVNAKHVRLYECRAYNPRNDENKRVYLAEKTIGKEEIYFGHTIQSVLDQVETAVAKEVQKQMIGEKDEQA